MRKPGINYVPNTNIKWFWWGWIMLFMACRPAEKREKTPLVSVGEAVLYREDIPPSVYKNQDSAAAVKLYVDNWIREHVFIHYARQNVDTHRINRLVEAYRNDLLRDLYENQLKNKWRDSIRLDREELENYYRQHKKNFIARDTFLRWRYVILNKDDPESRKIKKLFFSDKKEDKEKLESYFSHFLAFKLDSTGWYTYSKAADIVPPLKNISLRKGKYTFSRKKHLYLVEINRIIFPGEILPYDYLQNTLKKYVMERKLQEEIRHARKEMVEKAYQKHQIKFYQQ